MIRCLIVDDEPLARKVLEQHVSDYPGLQLAGSVENAFEAGDILLRQRVDLLLLDINMPKLSGIRFLETLQDRPLVVMTTAYPEYAVLGFEWDILDYLLKPISFERFSKMMARVKKEMASPKAETITVKADRKVHRIPVQDIFYVESMGDYVRIHTSKIPLMVLDTLKQLEETLTPFGFVRIHKSYLINWNRLEYMEGNQLRVGSVTLPIGQTYRDEVSRRLG